MHNMVPNPLFSFFNIIMTEWTSAHLGWLLIDLTILSFLVHLELVHINRFFTFVTFLKRTAILAFIQEMIIEFP